MLSKCANPTCSAKFQYLHAGKVFVVEHTNVKQGNAPGASAEISETRDRLRCFWLCSNCSRSMTIQASGAGGVRIAPARSILRGSESQSCEGASVEAKGLLSGPNPICGYHTLNTKRKFDLLVKELEFLDGGGYRLAMGWRAPLVFEDSPICPKPPRSACPNGRCVLLDFVPEEHRDRNIPCRHIPLNETGETLETLYNMATIEEIENSLREWLRKKIAELERAAGGGNDSG